MEIHTKEMIKSIMFLLEEMQETVNYVFVKEEELCKKLEIESNTLCHLEQALINFGDCLQNLDIAIKE